MDLLIGRALDRINKVQRVLHRMGRIISGNFDYRTTRGDEILRQLRIPSVVERRDYFICKLVYQSIHGLNPSYLNDFVLLNSDLHEHHTRSDRVFLPTVRHNMYSNSLAFRGGQLFNQLPDFVRNSCDVDDFSQNAKHGGLSDRNCIFFSLFSVFLCSLFSGQWSL